jgi:hypothetical protein
MVVDCRGKPSKASLFRFYLASLCNICSFWGWGRTPLEPGSYDLLSDKLSEKVPLWLACTARLGKFRVVFLSFMSCFEEEGLSLLWPTLRKRNSSFYVERETGGQ